MSESSQVDVVVAGAINTDLVALVDRAPEAGETITGSSFSIFGGGKGANQAVAASRAGVSVALAGAVGGDAFGEHRRDELAGEGIDLGGVVTITGTASGVALITVEAGGENRIAYVPGPTLDITGDQICGVLARMQPKVYLQPNEVPLDAARVALRDAKELGAVTVFNAAPDPEKVRELLADVDYLIVNEGEAIALSGSDGTMDEIAASLASQTATSVVLTAGADGVYGWHDGQSAHVPAPSIGVVDTTGAGDTFCGAFAARLAQGDDFEGSVKWAVFAASLATTVEGAQPSIPHAESVERFMAGR